MPARDLNGTLISTIEAENKNVHITVNIVPEILWETAELICLTWHRFVYLNLHSRPWKRNMNCEPWERCLTVHQGSVPYGSSHISED